MDISGNTSKTHIVHCRVCKQEIDINNENNWLLASRNYYYHKTCYGRFKESKEVKIDQDYIPLIFDYIARDLKVSYDYYKVKAQINQFLKDGMTCKGILFTLKYYYDKYGKENWERGYGGIGIVPYCYKEATDYWRNIELTKRGSLEKIVEQMQQLKKPKEVIKLKAKKEEQKTNINFDDILMEVQVDS